MMTDGSGLREEIMRIALLQSATDSACAPSDFLAREHVVVASHDDPGALPIFLFRLRSI